jgi:hypothetical protein
VARFPRPKASPPPEAAGFLLPLSATASLLLLLSSVSLQAAALQARSKVQAGQRLRQAEDQLMSAAQHLLAGTATPAVGQTGLVGPVAYRLVAFDGPHWNGAPAGGLQRGQAVAILELQPSAEQPRAPRAAFGLELARAVTPSGFGAQQLLAFRELGLRGRASQGVAP